MVTMQRKPNRLKSYNYSLPGYYFITICTHKQKELFGKIKNGKIIFNESGLIIKKNLDILNNFCKDVEVDHSIIMPNHVHLILISYKYEKHDSDRSKMIVSKLIQQFKSSCTKDIRNIKKRNIVVWQRSFYDRIIRNEKELYNIRKYVELNPLKWDLEKSFPENLEL